MPPVLVVNAGSTSLKLHLVGEGEDAERLESLDDLESRDVAAVAHRIVHGGGQFHEPVVIDGRTREQITGLGALAPLHNGPAVEAIAAAERALPDVPQVAVFDTTFHRTMPEEAAAYAVPARWRDEWGVKRYGFHGLSIEWAVERASSMLGRAAQDLKLVVCHLGGGSSVTAVRHGRSVDTTMGFSPLDGIPMTTRAGTLDPGAVIHVLRQRGLNLEQVDHELNFDSGLRALGGGSGDMRELEARAAAGNPDARLALEVFRHRVAGAVGAMAVACGGLDAIVFTAGIGEGSQPTREGVCSRLHLLGVELDGRRNDAADPDCDVASDTASVRVLVIRAREEVVAARAARALCLGR